VLIVGEAGIGKSRLALHFRQQLGSSIRLWIYARGKPFFQNTPFSLVSELLRCLLQQLNNCNGSTALNGRSWPRDQEDVDTQVFQMEQALESAGLIPAEQLPLLAPLLSLPLPAKYVPRPPAPDQRHRYLLGVLAKLLSGVARTEPAALVAEDLQWADPSSLELLGLIAEQGATAPLLLLFTVRPEFRSTWSLRSHHTQIALNPLSPPEVQIMLRQLGAAALPETASAGLAQSAAGVPLFIEELTRAALDSGTGVPDFGRAKLPASLLESLRTRLERLGPARETLETCAVLGGDFSYDLLHAVHRIGSERLQDDLRTLANEELLYIQGLAPQAAYRFKHDLIREAIYRVTSSNRRRDLHRQAALMLTRQYPAVTPAEVIARHWSHAGEIEPAIEQWIKAAKIAEERNAFPEALKSFREALSLVTAMPEGSERTVRELKLTQSILWMLIFVRGNAAPETVEAAERAIALAEQCGRFSQMVHLMIARGHSAFNAGDLSNAAAIGNRAVELALRDGHTGNLAYVYSLQIATRYNHGDLAGVERYFAEGLRYFENPLPFFGVGVPAVGAAALNAWMMGRADTARERETKMIALMNDDKHYHRAFGAYYAAILHILLKEYDQAEAWVTQAFEIAVKHQFPFPASLSRCVLGYVRGQLGRADDGIKLLTEGMAELNQAGAHIGAVRNMMWLAELLSRSGQLNQAVEVFEKALKANLNERVYFPEILRLRAEALIRQGSIARGVDDLHHGIAIARGNGALALELRLAVTLAQTLVARHQTTQARAMLCEITDRFIAGFNTNDMHSAQTLLEQLR